MKIWGVIFIVCGGFWTLAGFATYASDIQLGIAVSGINMVGLGLVMVFMSGRRVCPACGVNVPVGLTVCQKCLFDFRKMAGETKE